MNRPAVPEVPVTVDAAAAAAGRQAPPPRHHPVRRVFGPASDRPFRRRATDWNRLVAGALLAGLTAAHAGHPTSLEQHAFTLINGLPGGLSPLFTVWYRLATLWAIALVVLAALAARRWRLAFDLALAGTAAWLAGHTLGLALPDGIGAGVAVVHRLASVPRFPFVPLAVLAAVLGAAAPYLSRPSRHLGLAVLVVFVPAGAYLGIAFPNDLVGALALGWSVAAAVHLLFGSPAGRPTPDHVAACLEDLDVPVTGIRLAAHEPEGATLLDAEDARGPLRIKVLGRDAGETQLLAKLARAVLYKESGRQLHLTRGQEVEHEAYMLLLARAAGVTVPEVIVAGVAGPGAAVLVTREPAGLPLADLDPDTISDAFLEEAWRQVAALHAARVVHGRLNIQHLLRSPAGAAVTSFDLARLAGPGTPAAGDVAELLASTGLAVGLGRAVPAAIRGAGTGAVIAALPLLQAPALSRQTHAQAAGHRELTGFLGELRAAVASATGTTPPALQGLHRVSGINLVLAVGTLLAAGGLLSAVGSPHRLWLAVGHAQWGWVAAALALALIGSLPQAIALMGTVARRLPLWPTVELCVAQAFSAVAVPLGSAAMRVRFLQHFGNDLSSAVAAGGLLATVATMVAQLILLVVALLASPRPVHLLHLPHNLPAGGLVALAAIAVGTGVVLAVPRLHRLAVRPVEQAAETIWSALRSPRRLALLLGGDMAASVLLALCLDACLAAFGSGVSLWTLLALNIGINTLASLVPIPGGGAAVSAVALSGALVTLGVPQEAAVGAVLTYQLVTRYLPAIPGWVATRLLVRRTYL
jgi:uncharacterized membrane protein YbhN (UPF0104 family)/tRNA A-37 threonylcarbamoyl transferase component Bud32